MKSTLSKSLCKDLNSHLFIGYVLEAKSPVMKKITLKNYMEDASILSIVYSDLFIYSSVVY